MLFMLWMVKGGAINQTALQETTFSCMVYDQGNTLDRILERGHWQNDIVVAPAQVAGRLAR